MGGRVAFRAGRNVSIELPADQLEATVRFHRDVPGLPVHEGEEGRWVEFGAARLWLDPVAYCGVPELWLEVVTDHLEAAAAHLQAGAGRAVIRWSPSRPASRGFWIGAPCGVIHLVCTSVAP